MDFIVGIGFDLYQPSAGSASEALHRGCAGDRRLQAPRGHETLFAFQNPLFLPQRYPPTCPFPFDADCSA